MKEFLERISKLPPQRVMLLAAQLQERIDVLEKQQVEPIAIIGMSCRLPGGVESPEAFWQLLQNGVDAISEVPADRWNIDEFYDPDPEKPGKMSTRWGGFLKDVKGFDPHFFGISPREAQGMDPQQRLLLELCWEALERAGESPDGLMNSQTGVFVGISGFDYLQMNLDSGLENLDAYFASGNAHSIASGRLSYVLGLRGPSLPVDTACSSSLVAVHLAVQSLRNRECRAALAGGVNLILKPDITVALSKAHMLAPDGRCKAFDHRADGFVRGEGGGIVVLKRLSDALADGDNILALIRGSAVNQDGRSNGLTAPNGPSQEAVIRTALESGRVSPQQISYVEAHGTGTSLGDPIEVQALSSVLGAERKEPLMIGSVKTNIGHLESAAGIAGLIKIVLMLQHGQVPPHLHLQTLNPYIPWSELPVTVPTTLTSWNPDAERFAGVSSFGFSGTNSHIVLSSPPAREDQKSEVERPLHLFSLSARSETALRELASRYANDRVDSSMDIADLAYTTNTGRSHFNHRLAVAAASTKQLQQALSDFARGEQAADLVQGKVQGTRQPRVAFLFTGQGAQYTGMARQLYETEPAFRATLDQCDQILRPYLNRSLSSVIFAENEADQALINETAYTQPALFAVEYALAELWKSWGIHPSIVMGHSVGEYVAACIAGVFALEDGLKLIAERGRLMQQLPSGGAMAAIFASEDVVAKAIAPYTDQLSIAAINGPANIVISGAEKTLSTVLNSLAEQGIKSRRLTVSHAFHSPLMEPMLDAFERVADSIQYSEPHIGLISNATGLLAEINQVTNARYWREHVRKPVKFSDSIINLHKSGYEVFVEIGSNPTLLSMGQRCLPEDTGTWLPSLRQGKGDWETLLGSLARLYTLGVDVNWKAFDQAYARRKLVLPTYPFQREPYWIKTGTARRMRQHPNAESSNHPLLGIRLHTAGVKETIFESQISLEQFPFLADFRVYERALLPSPAYMEMMLTAAKVHFGEGRHTVENLVLHEALIIPESEPCTVQTVLKPEADGLSIQVFYQRDGNWHLSASAQVRQGTSTLMAAEELSAIQARTIEEVTAESCYETLAALGLDFGPSYRGVSTISRAEGETLCRMELPEEIAEETDQYRFIHPALLDACFHALGVASPKDGALLTNAYLFLGADQIRIQEKPGSQFWSHIKLRNNQDLESLAAQETFVADIHLYNDTGELFAELSGVSLKRATREMLLHSQPDNLLYETTWMPKPHAETEPAKNAGSWLIFTDAEGTGAQLAEALRSSNQDCVLVAQGEKYAELTPDRVQINPAEPADFIRLLSARIYSGAIYMWGLEDRLREDITAFDLLDMQVSTTSGLLHLAQAMAKVSKTNIPGLWVVTRGAQAAESVSAVNAGASAILGLSRTIALEHPELSCTRIDLNQEPEANEINSLLTEILQRDASEDEIALRDVRLVRRLTRKEVTDTTSLTFQSDASYLITGGLGGLGLLVAEWMVKQGALHLMLMGRRGVSEETKAKLATLGEKGAHIQILKGDVSKSEDLASALDRAKETMPPLRGIVHAAGVLDDGILLQQNRSRLVTVMAPKVQGTWNLHLLTRDLPLDFFVMFSSTAAILGSPGQSNYAAANAFMDGFAAYRHKQGLPATSINWGAWGEVGMAATHNTEKLRGVKTFTSTEGLRALGQILQQSASQLVVLPANWSEGLTSYPRGEEPAIYREIATQVKRLAAKKAETPRESNLVQQLSTTVPNKRMPLLIDHIRQNAAQVLKVDHSSSIDLHQPLHAMGLDSLMAVELRNTLGFSVGKTLPATLLFEFPTINELAQYIAKEVLALGSETKSTPAEDTQQPEPSNNLQVAKLDDLSEDELANMLEAKLRNLNS